MASVQIIDDANIQCAQNPRTCRTCGLVGHIARNCPQKTQQKETRACRVCGEVGHIGRDCPNKTATDAEAPNGGGGRRSGGLAGRRCFNCGKPGHLSANCELPPGNMSCYNCGQSGHKAVDCPAR